MRFPLSYLNAASEKLVMVLGGGVSHDAPKTSGDLAPPPNKPKASVAERPDKYSSPCATEQCSRLELGGFPSIPPPRSQHWLQSRCLATASHSVKGRGYSHVRTSDCGLRGPPNSVKPQVRAPRQFGLNTRRLRRRFVYRSAGNCRVVAVYARTGANSFRDRAVARLLSWR